MNRIEEDAISTNNPSRNFTSKINSEVPINYRRRDVYDIKGNMSIEE